MKPQQENKNHRKGNEKKNFNMQPTLTTFVTFNITWNENYNVIPNFQWKFQVQRNFLVIMIAIADNSNIYYITF